MSACTRTHSPTYHVAHAVTHTTPRTATHGTVRHAVVTPTRRLSGTSGRPMPWFATRGLFGISTPITTLTADARPFHHAYRHQLYWTGRSGGPHGGRTIELHLSHVKSVDTQGPSRASWVGLSSVSLPTALVDACMRSIPLTFTIDKRRVRVAQCTCGHSWLLLATAGPCSLKGGYIMVGDHHARRS